MEDNKVRPTGNDISDGDAREEERMDKDEDAKKEHDEDSSQSKRLEKRKITPSSLSAPDGNHGHSKHSMGENEQPDPTWTDAPDSKITRWPYRAQSSIFGVKTDLPQFYIPAPE